MKKALRKDIKEKIAELTPDEKKRMSEAIFLKIEQLPGFEKAKNILLFWSLPDEVITSMFFDKWSDRKCLLLPVINGDELELRYYEGRRYLKTGSLGVQEPQGKLFTEYDKIDMVLVPGVAFDRDCNRLGRGKGYYDKLLPKLSGMKIGICYPCQLLDQVPCQEWDVKMDKIITVE